MVIIRTELSRKASQNRCQPATAKFQRLQPWAGTNRQQKMSSCLFPIFNCSVSVSLWADPLYCCLLKMYCILSSVSGQSILSINEMNLLDEALTITSMQPLPYSILKIAAIIQRDVTWKVQKRHYGFFQLCPLEYNHVLKSLSFGKQSQVVKNHALCAPYASFHRMIFLAQCSQIFGGIWCISLHFRAYENAGTQPWHPPSK